MPKIPARDQVLNAIDKARRAHASGRPILEPIPEHGDLGEVFQKNLDRSYKQRNNSHLSQLHYIGTCIRYYKGEGINNGSIRRTLGLTRPQYYMALAITKVIQDPEVIPYLEELSAREIGRLSEKDQDYVHYGAWPILVDPEQQDQKRKEQEEQMRNLLRDLLE